MIYVFIGARPIYLYADIISKYWHEYGTVYMFSYMHQYELK